MTMRTLWSALGLLPLLSCSDATSAFDAVPQTAAAAPSSVVSADVTQSAAAPAAGPAQRQVGMAAADGGAPIAPVLVGMAGAAGAASIPTSLPSEALGSLMASITVPAVLPGAEDHVCAVIELDNALPVWVNDVHVTLGHGSHHLVVDRRPASEPAYTTPATCAPSAGNDTRITVAQQRDTHLSLPAHVAFRFEARQHLFLLLHYFNAGSEAVDISGHVELGLAPLDETAPAEVHTMFTGPLIIELPPGELNRVSYFNQTGRTTIGWRHVLGVTSHMHQLGLHATIERVPSFDAPPTRPIHESFDWMEPPQTRFEPALVLGPEDGLRLSCEYYNSTDRLVRFGPSFEDEMCCMWVYYFDR